MNTKPKNDTSRHDNNENKSKQQHVKELIQLIQKNDIKNLGSWLENYNDSKIIVCTVLTLFYMVHDISCQNICAT